MTETRVLVLGGTGPAGICLLRELLYRQFPTTVFARNPTKTPEDIASNPLLEVIKGELDDTSALTTAVSKCTVIISLVGPNTLRGLKPATFTDFYTRLFKIMRDNGVRRIFAMSTLSYSQPQDQFSLFRFFVVWLVYIVANAGYHTACGIGQVFEKEASGLDWTVFRIARIPGGSDEASWRKDREDGEAFEGWIGEKGWMNVQRRGALARWLVDAAEDGKTQWIGKMPAVSKLAGSKRRAD